MPKKFTHYLTVGVLFHLAVLCGFAHAKAAEPVLRGGIYIIQMSNSDMTVAATSEKVGSPMILWPYRPTATWDFTHLGNNVYTIRSNSTMLDGGQSSSGAPVRIGKSKSSDGQKWKLRRVGRYYHFTNVKTGLAMKLGNGQRKKGSRLTADASNNSQEQLFCVQRSSEPRFCNGSNDVPSKKDKTKNKKNKKNKTSMDN